MAHRQNPGDIHWALCFGKHPEAELYDLKTDRDCLTNLTGSATSQPLQAQLKQQLFDELKTQDDPRISGNAQMFEQFPYSDASQRNFYERFMGGEKLRPSWVNESDFEPN
jgi:N-sulfoglucosamine sulfohydrolase